MTDTIHRRIDRSAARCHAAFCDFRHLADWVPGLRRARLISTWEGGLPREVLFEYGDKLTYSLVYTYDQTSLKVTWEPGVGRLDAVRGWARFDEAGDACEMTYAIEPAVTGDATERHHNGATIADAFVRWMQSVPV